MNHRTGAHVLFAMMCILILSSPAVGQEDRFDRVLLPVAIAEPVPGGYGSIWTTQFVGLNGAPVDVKIRQGSPETCRITCPNDQFPPQETFTFGLIPEWTNGGPTYLWIESDLMDQVDLHLRVQDISRQAETWGTSIPIVYESDVYTERLVLLDIPTDDRFRQTLRIYDFDGAGETQARIRVFSQTQFPILLAETVVTMPWFEGITRPGFVLIPSLTSSFPAIRNEERVLVEVTPVTEGLRFWAFVSVTNNETQHVTVISPR